MNAIMTVVYYSTFLISQS